MEKGAEIVLPGKIVKEKRKGVKKVRMN